MKHSLKALFVSIPFSVLSPASLALLGSPAFEGRPGIEVRLYNDVRIPEEHVAAAERVASGVLGQAGIELAWTDCTITQDASARAFSPCQSSAPGGIVVYLVGPLEAHFKWVVQNALGYSIIPDAHALATMAYISYPRVQKLSASTSVEPADLLGLAVAHEIGHLLFGSRSHANQGIMRTPWRLRDLESKAWNEFEFTHDQARRLRTAVRSRLESTKLGITTPKS